MLRKKSTKIILIIFAIILTIVISVGIMLWNGIIFLNNPSIDEYPVRGVDVSSYQGKIDWKTLSEQDIQFAFIKATEGSSFVDPNFSENYSNAQKTNLRIGAYHFFSYDSSGKTQAENFIKVVPISDNMLPPVVDVEFYSDKEQNPPNSKDVDKELNAFLQEIEKYYKKKPIIYATGKSYDMFISGKYNDYNIWIRNILSYPSLSDNKQWTFWQYTDRAVLDGYSGDEKFIDMNVFNGSKEDFNSL
ncbi:GH25 family lysozyme [Candidatus Pseudoruminococcus sp.]|uniref:glycoside hydrolase family 25 protein n=1 Tax=Candidatus Pseudoruminococcus sp. TaxID=3101048 RepID=UPI003999D1B8